MFKQRSSLTTYKPNFTVFLQEICIAVCLILPFYHCESISPAFVQIEVETGEPTARRPSKKQERNGFSTQRAQTAGPSGLISQKQWKKRMPPGCQTYIYADKRACCVSHHSVTRVEGIPGHRLLREERTVKPAEGPAYIMLQHHIILVIVYFDQREITMKSSYSSCYSSFGISMLLQMKLRPQVSNMWSRGQNWPSSRPHKGCKLQ